MSDFLLVGTLLMFLAFFYGGGSCSGEIAGKPFTLQIPAKTPKPFVGKVVCSDDLTGNQTCKEIK